MTSSSDALIVLRARRSDLYERLRLIDGRVADAQKSPFFSTRPGNSVTMRDSIEGVERQIADIDRQLELARSPAPEDAGLAANSGEADLC